ncbi:anti-sigma factor antagonist [Saccharothrix longispora]|uniref:Anti-sigma factor antagonist n=1 Tax=Saccharothrix longispora TaxID=33920 RepID=A0ABU1PUZ1_9PSEU|nr:anti-sigma factor antagonist [Saccharothrix longispora]MDR6594439.1 anti-anti-sigma factor [Saccharothrix longispora]
MPTRLDATDDLLDGRSIAAREASTLSADVVDVAGCPVVVRATGEVDGRSAPVLAAALRTGCAAAGPPRPLVVDLTGLRFFSAAGVNLLVAARRRCDARQVPLLLVATHRAVLRSLRAAGVGALFDVRPSLTEAITSVGNTAP